MTAGDRGSPPWVLGISASHNGSACLLHGDEVVVAVQEERLTRQKRARVWAAEPSLCVRYCLDHAGVHPSQLDMVVACAQTHAGAPRNDVRLNPLLQVGLHGVSVATISHHTGHAVSAFATSGFDASAVLVVDGLGSPYADLAPEERTAVAQRVVDGWESISIYAASGTGIRPLEKHLVERGGMLRSPDAGEPQATTEVPDWPPGMPRFGTLGGMYAAAAYQVFGDTLDGSGKLMGLAPYGYPSTTRRDFFEIAGGRLVFSDAVPARYRHAERWPRRREEYQDLAASVQAALEEALLHFAGRARELAASDQLCYAGGVALNSVANERIIREAGFRAVHVVPAAEDSGPALGAAFWGLWRLGRAHRVERWQRDAVGRPYTVAEIDDAIAAAPAIQAVAAEDVAGTTAALLVEGRILGWFQGRSELGPRALGQRSILCDPRRPDARQVLNARVKHREGFRPFAPTVLAEHAADWFALDGVPADSPFMLRVCAFRSERRHEVPAVVHVDGTGRLQTVTAEGSPDLHALLRRFHELTGVPILLNTSFNVAGEPIVETPQDALWCLLVTGLDGCVLADRIVTKREAYRCILDMHVRLAAERLAVELPLPVAGDGHRLGLACAVRTPWGDARQPVDVEALEVMRMVDGRRTGWDLLELTGGPTRDEAWLTGVLARLRRGSVVTLHEEPGPSRTLPDGPWPAALSPPVD